MLTARNIGFLNIQCIRRIAIALGISFDINRKAHRFIERMILIGRIVIDVELAVVIILDRIGDDLGRRIVAWYHTLNAVNYRSGQNETFDILGNVGRSGCRLLVHTLVPPCWE